MPNYKLKTPEGIENTVIKSYKKIEDGVVGAYKKIEDKFVATFLEEVPPANEDSSENDSSKGSQQ